MVSFCGSTYLTPPSPLQVAIGLHYRPWEAHFPAACPRKKTFPLVVTIEYLPSRKASPALRQRTGLRVTAYTVPPSETIGVAGCSEPMTVLLGERLCFMYL